MQLRTRLLVGFATIILFMGAFGLYAGYKVEDIFRISREVQTATIISQTSLDFNVENFHTQLEVWEYAYEPTEKRLKAFELHNEKLSELLGVLTELVEKEIRTEVETGERYALYDGGEQHIKEIASNLNKVRTDWVPLLEKIKELRAVAAAGYGEGSEQYEKIEEGVKKLALANEDLFDELKFNIRIDEFVAAQQALVRNLAAEQKSLSSKFRNALFIILITIMVLGLGIALFISQSITKFIKKLKNMALEISKGNLDVSVEIESKDEIGVLAASFNQMAEDLQKSRNEIVSAKKHVENIFKSMIDTLIVVTPQGRIQTVNQATCDLLGYQTEELIEQPIGKILREEKVKRVSHETGLQELIKREFIKGVEKSYLAKNGRRIPILFSGSVMRDSDGKIQGIICVASDISARKHAEAALRESEERLTRSKKMESLGLLAGGVAHDLNNVLAGVVSYPELLLLDLPEDSPLRKPIETMRETGHRATAIVQDLLTVARGVAITKEPLKLNAIVEDYLLSSECEKLIHFHPSVSIKTNLDTDLLNISGSDPHLRKVIMNLVSNAVEAIEGGSDVIISTMNRYIDKPLGGYEDVKTGEYAILSVSDEGPGISPDDLERIFEPFFTKKVMGKSGTGLGLAVVWNVVQDHKGYIDVISDDNGTTFELYFPITREEVSDKDLSIPIQDYKGNGETVLVVDDVESQREIVCAMLKTLGYRVKTVPSGEEAVEYLKEHSVDLILLDMIMDPGINGRETYERIIKIHPDQKAIIASGFADTDDVKEAQKLGAGQYIKKPLTIEIMGLAVRDELKR
jgi:two-component system cell cycle sensor histidine kinase/response regulator CckA